MISTMTQALSAGSFALTGMSLDVPPANCFIYRLPSELKYEVLSHLESKRDLYNVSRTCRWLEGIALKRLYRVVDIDIPAEKSSTWATGGYLRLRNHVLGAVEHITIRDGVSDFQQSHFHRRRRSDAGCPESYASQVVERIPCNQLRSFLFMHRSPVSLRLLQILKARHGNSLKSLSCYELLPVTLPVSALLAKLETFECRSIDDGESLGRLVQASRDTLTSLRLGGERELVSQYYRLRSGSYDGSPRPLDALVSIVKLSDITNLRNLSLTGLNVAALAPTEIEDALYLTNLDHLTLESCPGSTEFISAMTTIFQFAQADTQQERKRIPKLRNFLFRNEAMTTPLREALVAFLNSFSGLETLSLLFENWTMSDRLGNLLPNHGTTLRELTIESRVQPRENLRIDTSRPFGMGGYHQQLWEDSIDDVCRLCPNLSELSMGFPWNDELIRIREPQLPALPLKTMHIRNFPEARGLAQMGDYSIKEHGIKFLEWTYGNIRGCTQPELESLSIGPSLYESRFKGANPNRVRAPEFLRTHHFTIDWALTRFGRWSPMITPVSEKYMEEMRGEKPLGGIFQQVWLK